MHGGEDGMRMKMRSVIKLDKASEADTMYAVIMTQ